MRPYVPQIHALPARNVLTITAVGSPASVFPKIMPSLYGTAYTTKFKALRPRRRQLTIGACVAAYPKARATPRRLWNIITDLEVTGRLNARDLIQKQPELPVRLTKRPAATYAEILHIGWYAKEARAVRLLKAFIQDHGWRIVGPHEEVYLSRPGPKAKTIIRYAVRRR